MKSWRRPKRGFALPLHRMRHELKVLIITTLTEPRSLTDIFQGRRDQSIRIWRLLMLEPWNQNFLEGRPFENDQAEVGVGESV